MNQELKIYKIGEICKGFTYDEAEEKGLFGLNGKLIIQPEYQRNYIYNNGSSDKEVIYSVLNGISLNLFHFNRRSDGKLEVLDGQQRITSLGRFITNKFIIKDEHGEFRDFNALSAEKKEKFLNTELIVMECECTEDELIKLFRGINVPGYVMNDQELLNQAHHGPFITKARKEFSSKEGLLENNLRSRYMKGTVNRQDHLKTALDWASEGNIKQYMIEHRYDENIEDLKSKTNNVIDWVSSIFKSSPKEMKSVNWGVLYRKYRNNSYNVEEVDELLNKLYFKPEVSDKKGIFEYILNSCANTK